jgi:hypothetical protein
MTEDRAGSRSVPGWGPALAHALLGRVPDTMVLTGPDTIDAVLEVVGGIDAVIAHRRHRLGLGEPWPHRVPDGLHMGVGPAQFQAVLGQAVARVLAHDSSGARRVVTSRRLSAGELRLASDVPPHHGG